MCFLMSGYLRAEKLVYGEFRIHSPCRLLGAKPLS